MLLKRLELQGLKSFADKTVLDLSGNVTAIVGPNGSGKSNVTDGIRWLLGERDARNLRGAKGEDLIFAGTESRPRMGLAQATIYFDNSSGFFPVDFKEVTISRRISRDGTSSFFLNNSEVRLKDIIDFLARARLGARGLTVINQGESDAFIVATPIERREMIEEILGLKEYQLRKADASRKLKSTSDNLEKVNALIEELKPHLRLLKRQSSRYEARDKIQSELKEMENNFFGGRLKRLQNELKEHDKSLKEIEDKLQKATPAFKVSEKKLAEVSQSEPKATKDIKEIQTQKTQILQKRAEIERELGKVETQLEYEARVSLRPDVNLEEVLKDIKKITQPLIDEKDLAKLQAAIKKVSNIVEKLFSHNSESPAKSNQIEEAQKKLQKSLEDLNKELEALTKKEIEIQKTLEGFNSAFRKAYENVEKERRLLDSLNAEKSRASLSKERTDLKLNSLKEELTQIGRDIKSFEKIEVQKEIPESEEYSQNTKMFKLRQELASIGDIDEAIVKEARETEERHDYLLGQTEDLKKASTDLKSLIKELDEKVHSEFTGAIKEINKEFTNLVKTMFGGGHAKLIVQKPSRARSTEDTDAHMIKEDSPETTTGKDSLGIEVDIALPKKKIKGLEVLSGGERSLVSIAALFALISVSPPPFLVFDEVDAALDESNAKRFGKILEEFSKKTQFVLVTHNRATMEAASALYGVTMSGDGTSKLVSLKLE